MFCYNCGEEVEEGTRFCTNCGVPLDKESPSQAGQAAQPAAAGPGAGRAQPGDAGPQPVSGGAAASRRKLLVAVLVLAIAACSALAAYLVCSHQAASSGSPGRWAVLGTAGEGQQEEATSDGSSDGSADAGSSGSSSGTDGDKSPGFISSSSSSQGCEYDGILYTNLSVENASDSVRSVPSAVSAGGAPSYYLVYDGDVYFTADFETHTLEDSGSFQSTHSICSMPLEGGDVRTIVSGIVDSSRSASAFSLRGSKLYYNDDDQAYECDLDGQNASPYFAQGAIVGCAGDDLYLIDFDTLALYRTNEETGEHEVVLSDCVGPHTTIKVFDGAIVTYGLHFDEEGIPGDSVLTCYDLEGNEMFAEEGLDGFIDCLWAPEANELIVLEMPDSSPVARVVDASGDSVGDVASNVSSLIAVEGMTLYYDSYAGNEDSMNPVALFAYDLESGETTKIADIASDET